MTSKTDEKPPLLAAGSRTNLIFASAALAVIFGTGFFIRYQYFILNGGSVDDYIAWADLNYFGGITRGYITGVKEILNLQKWSTLGYPPGYSFVLAIFSLMGAGSLQAMRVYQAGLDSLTVFPLFYIGLRLSGSRTAAFVAPAAYAVLPLFAFGAVMLLAEGLSPCLTALFLALLLWARNGRTWRWAAPAAEASCAALIRPDLLLFAIPLTVWWLFTSRKAATAIAVLIGFGLPLLAWGDYSRFSNGHFSITSSSGGYGLWAGLGQLPNDFGYVVSDSNAAEVLQAHGLAWASPEANSFWFNEYLQAVLNHPAYVLHTILWRLEKIPFIANQYSVRGFDPATIGYSYSLDRYLNEFGLYALAISLGILVWKRQFAAAFLVGLPLVYAWGSLGPLYYEPRYVRYVALSYILAPPIAVAFILPKRYLFVVSSAFILWIAADTVPSFPGIVTEARVEAGQNAIVALAGAGQARVVAKLDNIAWIKSVPEVQLSQGSDGLTVTTSTGATAYQIVAAAKLPAGLVVVQYKVILHEGGVAIGVLSPDGGRWLKVASIQTIGVNDDRIALMAPEGAIVVFINNRSDPGVSRFTIEQLNYLQAPQN